MNFSSHRKLHARLITGLLKRFPVVAILGARQVGKTTLAASIAPTVSNRISRFDLENPSDLARLADPMPALQDLLQKSFLDAAIRFTNFAVRSSNDSDERMLDRLGAMQQLFAMLGNLLSGYQDLLRQYATSKQIEMQN